MPACVRNEALSAAARPARAGLAPARRTLLAGGASGALALLLGSTGLGGCAAVPAADPAPLLRDDLFPPVALPVGRADLFALSDAMRRYAATHLLGPQAPRDRRRALVQALYDPQGLLLAYDATQTRSAAETHAQRAGNCLSLVIMTAAFAHHLELPVRYQRVHAEAEYSRSGDLYLVAGHVNVVVGHDGRRSPGDDAQWLTIDFLPQVDLRNQRADPIDEGTIVAMFMNNRAAEALTEGRLAEAYAWSRQAVQQDPRFVAAVNTLAVIYLRAGHPVPAEQALRHALAREPGDANVLANLVHLLKRLGRDAEAAPWETRLARLQSEPPFWWLDRAREALARGDTDSALSLLRRELRRQPVQHEVHFELARTYAARGDPDGALRHLALARENSPTPALRGLYAGKIDRLRAARMQ